MLTPIGSMNLHFPGTSGLLSATESQAKSQSSADIHMIDLMVLSKYMWIVTNRVVDVDGFFFFLAYLRVSFSI